MKKQILAAAAIATVIGFAAAPAVAMDKEGMNKEGMEKCYGVVKAGKNDCGANGHSCAAQAATDGDKKEWVMVPTGLCDKLVGGSTTAAE